MIDFPASDMVPKTAKDGTSDIGAMLGRINLSFCLNISADSDKNEVDDDATVYHR